MSAKGHQRTNGQDQKFGFVRYCPKADKRWYGWNVRFVPCVDGSELARTFFTFAALVGAAMCSACSCGTRGRWP
jgi:hypothetical protein